MRVCACVKQGGTMYKEETRLTSGKRCVSHEADDSLSFRAFSFVISLQYWSWTPDPWSCWAYTY